MVMDTNTLVRGMLNRKSAAGVVMERCVARQYRLLLSLEVLKEYREVLGYPHIVQRSGELMPEAIALVLIRLRQVSDYYGKVTRRFRLERDPRDEKFIALALVGQATHLVTQDDDLLSLATGHDATAKRFRRMLPGIRVTPAKAFLESQRERGEP